MSTACDNLRLKMCACLCSVNPCLGCRLELSGHVGAISSLHDKFTYAIKI